MSVWHVMCDDAFSINSTIRRCGIIYRVSVGFAKFRAFLIGSNMIKSAVTPTNHAKMIKNKLFMSQIGRIFRKFSCNRVDSIFVMEMMIYISVACSGSGP